MDSKLSYAHRSGRRLDERVVDAEWRKDKLVVVVETVVPCSKLCSIHSGLSYMYFFHCRLPQVDIDVPAYELPLPEGVGQEQLHGENLSMREIEEMWKEKLVDSHTIPEQT